MKFLSETTGIEVLARAREELRTTVSSNELKAKDCHTCETRGICCTDIHFVNVRITELEAKVIAEAVFVLPMKIGKRVVNRVLEAARKLEDDQSAGQEEGFYSCPLFDQELGCAVHEVKPGACIHHACYESREDLPPASLLERYEKELTTLNRRVYGKDVMPQPIPIALARVLESSHLSKSSTEDCHGEQQTEKD
jgi:Fe-S-cluster containining protein